MADQPDTDTPELPIEIPEPEEQGEPELQDPGKKALTAERRARAVAEKEAKSYKAKLDELEAAKLSESERDRKDAEAARAEATEAKAEALRWRIAARHSVSDEDAELFLTGSDEETLTKQAERLSARNPAPGKGTHVPGVGNQPSKPPTLAEQIRAAEAAGDRSTAMALKAKWTMSAQSER